MAYENIKIQHKNFCIAPLIGTYGTIVTTNVETFLQFKNDSGDSLGVYELSEFYDQDLEIDSLDYVGPRTLGTLFDGLPFVTMTDNGAGSCTIKKWELNETIHTLDLVSTITKSSGGIDRFECHSSSVISYRTQLSTGIEPGDYTFQVNAVDGMNEGDTI
jgi:hypothetical protein